MFVYALTQPIDCFDGLIPLPRWITEDPDNNTAWALRATLALADARAQAGWTGGMRHLPSIGAIPAPGTADLFMVIWSPCTLVDRFPLCRIYIRNVNRLLKAHRAHFPQAALFPDAVVIPLDVVEYRGPGLFGIQPQMLVDELFLDRGVK